MSIDKYVIQDKDSLSTSIVHLVNPSTRIEIDLISASHIGSTQYYEEIKRRLEGLDYVLHENGSSKHFVKIADIERRYHNATINHVIRELIRSEGMEKRRALEIGQILKERMTVISQTEGIDYDNLPSKWRECDLSAEEIVEGLGHKELFPLVVYEVLSLTSSWFPRFIADKLANLSNKYLDRFLETPHAEQKNREREAKVYAKLEELETDLSAVKIGVFYGVSHMKHIEAELFSKGYVRNPNKPIEYIEAFKKRIEAALIN